MNANAFWHVTGKGSVMNQKIPYSSLQDGKLHQKALNRKNPWKKSWHSINQCYDMWHVITLGSQGWKKENKLFRLAKATVKMTLRHAIVTLPPGGDSSPTGLSSRMLYWLSRLQLEFLDLGVQGRYLLPWYVMCLLQQDFVFISWS